MKNVKIKTGIRLSKYELNNIMSKPYRIREAKEEVINNAAKAISKLIESGKFGVLKQNDHNGDVIIELECTIRIKE
ncbi:MAG: hypothetical protein ACRDCN_11230 [Tannerellaceae bacterium]